MMNFRGFPLTVVLQLLACALVWLQANSVSADESPTVRNPFSSSARSAAPKTPAAATTNPFRSAKPAAANQTAPQSLPRAAESKSELPPAAPPVQSRDERGAQATNPFTALRTTPKVPAKGQAPAPVRRAAIEPSQPVVNAQSQAAPPPAAAPATSRWNRLVTGMLPQRDSAPAQQAISTAPPTARVGSVSNNSRVEPAAALGPQLRASNAYAVPMQTNSGASRQSNRPALALGAVDGLPAEPRQRSTSDRQVKHVSPVAVTGKAPRPFPGVAQTSPLGRSPIVFRPGVPTLDAKGNMMLRPDVVVADGDRLPQPFPSGSLPSLDEAPAKQMPQPKPQVVAASAPMQGNERSIVRAVEQQNSHPRPSPRTQQQRQRQPQRQSQVTSPVYRTAQQSPQHPPTMQHPPMMQSEPRVAQPMSSEELPPGATWMPQEELPEGMPMDQAWETPEGMPYDEGGGDCAESLDDPWMPPVGGNAWMGGSIGRACDGVLGCLHGPPCYQGALGVERVMFAPFFIETTQPLQNCRVRFDNAWDQEFPDRAEYFWAKTPPTVQPDYDGNGATADVGEPSVDYQDVRFMIERGTPKFSVATEIPLRFIDPDLRRNTGGLGNLNLTTKTVLLDGRKWQLSQIFRTYFPTGSSHRGTGNGLYSFEPGVAYRYKYSDITYFHGDLKYWFPVGGDPFYSGQFLNYGIGVSHVAVDQDCFAVIPTFEVVAWTVLDGRQTLPYEVPPQDQIPPSTGEQGMEVDNMSIVNLCPGVRFVWDNGHDCGTRELGISGGFAVSNDQWYESILRIDLRWSY